MNMKEFFTFTPDTEITDRYSFANALYAYAMKENKELIITKEGMYPEFVMDGITYTAERNYTRVAWIPVAVIRCTRKYSDEKEYKHGRKNGSESCVFSGLQSCGWYLFLLQEDQTCFLRKKESLLSLHF